MERSRSNVIYYCIPEEDTETNRPGSSYEYQRKSLYDAILSPTVNINHVSSAWLNHYRTDIDGGICELFDLAFKAAGCYTIDMPYEFVDDLLKAESWFNIKIKECHHSKCPKLQGNKFIRDMGYLIQTLLSKDISYFLGERYENFFFPFLWIVSKSESPSVRLAADIICLKFITCIVSAEKVYHSKLLFKNHLSIFLSGSMMDFYYQVRKRILKELRTWIVKMPDTFITERYLKYIASSVCSERLSVQIYSLKCMYLIISNESCKKIVYDFADEVVDILPKYMTLRNDVLPILMTNIYCAILKNFPTIMTSQRTEIILRMFLSDEKRRGRSTAPFLIDYIINTSECRCERVRNIVRFLSQDKYISYKRVFIDSLIENNCDSITDWASMIHVAIYDLNMSPSVKDKLYQFINLSAERAIVDVFPIIKPLHTECIFSKEKQEMYKKKFTDAFLPNLLKLFPEDVNKNEKRYSYAMVTIIFTDTSEYGSKYIGIVGGVLKKIREFFEIAKTQLLMNACMRALKFLCEETTNKQMNDKCQQMRDTICEYIKRDFEHHMESFKTTSKIYYGSLEKQRVFLLALKKLGSGFRANMIGLKQSMKVVMTFMKTELPSKKFTHILLEQLIMTCMEYFNHEHAESLKFKKYYDEEISKDLKEFISILVTFLPSCNFQKHGCAVFTTLTRIGRLIADTRFKNFKSFKEIYENDVAWKLEKYVVARVFERKYGKNHDVNMENEEKFKTILEYLSVIESQILTYKSLTVLFCNFNTQSAIIRAALSSCIEPIHDINSSSLACVIADSLISMYPSDYLDRNFNRKVELIRLTAYELCSLLYDHRKYTQPMWRDVSIRVLKFIFDNKDNAKLKSKTFFVVLIELIYGLNDKKEVSRILDWLRDNKVNCNEPIVKFYIERLKTINTLRSFAPNVKIESIEGGELTADFTKPFGIWIEKYDSQSSDYDTDEEEIDEKKEKETSSTTNGDKSTSVRHNHNREKASDCFYFYEEKK